MSKTYKCIVGVDRWKHETDHAYCISPTGKKVAFYYHGMTDGKHWTHKVDGPEFTVRAVLGGYYAQPKEGEDNQSTNWQRNKTMELTAEEMQTFLALSKKFPY